MKKCPYCAEEIRDEAIRCKHCGQDLVAAPSKSVGSPTFRVMGALLFVGGAIGLAFFFRMDTAVDTPFGYVNNLGLMNDRSNGLMISCVAAVAGFALLLVGQRRRA